jgi:hypothetical protein
MNIIKTLIHIFLGLLLAGVFLCLGFILFPLAYFLGYKEEDY